MSLDAAQEVAVEIAASPAECFAAILEFERYPEWSSAIQSARVLERDAAGVGRRVEFHIDMKIRRVRYVLEYTYRKPTELSWRSVDGDIDSIEGRYRFRKLGPKLTEASCRQEIQLGFWMPGPLRKLAERTALKQSVNEFKADVEQRVVVRASGGAEKSRRRAAGTPATKKRKV
jgi:ribosome-associated toxin RatA of RatAB toxin-antitoxin module